MTKASREELLRRQCALAKFGELVLRSSDLHDILTEGCRLIAEALGVDLAKVLEIEQARGSAIVLAGVGWNWDIVGKQRIALDDRSSEAYAIEQGKPVVMQDLANETRFHIPDFMKAHGIVALVNVPIFLPGGEAFGLLQVDAREPREFGADDIEFLRTYAMILGPVIDRLRKVAELERDSERLQLVLEGAHDYAILLSDADDIITDWFAGSDSIFGWRADEIIGQPGSVLFIEEDRSNRIPEWEMGVAVEKGAAPNVRWHRRKDGSRVFIDGQTIALRRRNGAVRSFMKIGQDTTERRRAEERQGMLLAELQHRVRNVLAMVRSVASKGNGASVEEFRAQLVGRITAMARTQALLTSGAGVGVDLEHMIRAELASHSGEDRRMTVSGPNVRLAPKGAEVLTLAIHELATNAVKYGALNRPDGELDVSWSTEMRSGVEWLSLAWRESGVPIDITSQSRAGFGKELVTRRVPYELRGQATMDLQPDGMRCTITFPLSSGPQHPSDRRFSRRSRGRANRGEQMTSVMPLAGRSVLVLEDNYLLAEETLAALEEAGARVLGPFQSLEETAEALRSEHPDCAFVDINLGHGPTFEPARALRAASVPIIFTTGYDASVIPPDLRDVLCLQKPIDSRRLVKAAAEICLQ